MNEFINNFLMTLDKFMPQLHLKQSIFTYSTREPFNKHRERISKLKKTRKFIEK